MYRNDVLIFGEKKWWKLTGERNVCKYNFNNSVNLVFKISLGKWNIQVLIL